VHEISVAQNIVDNVICEAEKDGAASITRVVPSIAESSEMKAWEGSVELKVIVKEDQESGSASGSRKVFVHQHVINIPFL